MIFIQIKSFTMLAILRVTSLRGPFPRHCARKHSFVQGNVVVVVSRWQQCVRFDRLRFGPKTSRSRGKRFIA